MIIISTTATYLLSRERKVRVCAQLALSNFVGLKPDRIRPQHMLALINSKYVENCGVEMFVGEQSVSVHSRLIRQNYEWLTESLDPHSGLLMTLFSKEVLSQRERDQIIAEKDRFVNNEILLSIISRKSVEDFKKFIISLNETSQGYIAEKLTETAIGM